MPKAKYVVSLSEEERGQLVELTRRGKSPVRKVKRARILLKSSEGLTDSAVAEAVETSPSSFPGRIRVRKRFVEEGLEQALNEQPRSGHPLKLDERHEAHLIAIACSQAPEGHERWTLRLLADKVVELELVDSIGKETVRQVLKKTNLSPGERSSGAFRR